MNKPMVTAETLTWNQLVEARMSSDRELSVLARNVFLCALGDSASDVGLALNRLCDAINARGQKEGG